MTIKEINRSKWYLPGLLGLLLLFPVWISAQQDSKFEGLAGPDKNTCINPATGQTQPVQIGQYSISGWCYTWTPVTGLDDPHAAKPTATPSQTTTYHLKVTFDNFEGEVGDDMVVRVNEGVNSLTAEPKRCCFKAGETFTYDMFNITTDPPGLENRVKFDPPKAPVQNDYEYYAPVTVSVADCNGGGTVTYGCLADVVNEDFQGSTVIGIPFKYAQKWADAKKKIDDFMFLWNEGISTTIPVCAPDPFDWSVQFKYNKYMMCCPEKTPCPDTAYSGSLGAKLQGGFTCDFPFYGVPYIAALNVRLTGALAFTVTGNYKPLCNGFELCFPLGIAGQLGGGISGTIFAKKALDASLILRGQVSAEPIKVCIVPFKIEGNTKICSNVDIVGTIKLVSLVTIQGTWPLVGKSCFPLF